MSVSRCSEGRSTPLGHSATQSWHAVQCCAKWAALHEPGRVHLCQDRREGARVQVETVAQLAHRGATLPPVPFPEDHHHQILGVGEAERLEQGLVGAHHLLGGRVEREAELVAQTEEVALVLAREGGLLCRELAGRVGGRRH